MDPYDVSFAGNEDVDWGLPIDSCHHDSEVNTNFYDSHLSAPITNDDPEFLLTYEKFYCKRHIKIKEHLRKHDITRHVYETCHDPWTCLEASISSEIDPGYRKFSLASLIKIASRQLELARSHYTVAHNSGENNFAFDPPSILGEDSYHELDKLYKLKIIAETIKNKFCNREAVFGKFKRITKSIKVEKDVFTFECPKHGRCIGPTTLLLGVLDLLQSRFLLFMVWVLSDLKQVYPSQSMYTTGSSIFKVFTDCRSKLGGEFFNLIKAWEPLLVGFTINDKMSDLGFSTLYEGLEPKAKALLEACGHTVYEILPTTTTIECLKLYLELTGMSKCFGHPCLNMITGFEELKRHALNTDPFDIDVVAQVVGVAVMSFCFEHYRKHNSWPPLQHDLCDPTSLIYQKLCAGTISDDMRRLSALKEWSRIRVAECLKFNYGLDPADILKDTAISSPRYEWFTQYDRCAFMNLWGKDKPRTQGQPSEKRVMLYYLSGDEQEQYQKIQEVIHGETRADRDGIATLCRKEREINPKGRLFVKQTYQQRLLQVLTEKNISTSYFPYVPEQTMDNSELALMKRQTQTTRAMARSMDIISLDLEKWCLHMRHPVLSGLGRHLDDVFGVPNVYENSHLWFLTCLVFPNARHKPPDYDPETLMPIPGDHHYVGHLGGMEGMHQKKWTIFTISVIKLVAMMLNVTVGIMGQGDNQVVILKYSSAQMANKDEIRSRFLATLYETFGKCKMRLKPEETWYSCRLFEYGKIRFLNGSAVRLVTKKAHNIVADINTGVCSDYSCLSTISTAGESIARGDHDAQIGYWVACFETINYLDRKGILTDGRKSSALLCLNFPGILGGFPITSFISCSLRGVDDPLPYWFCLYRFIERSDPKLFSRLKKCIPLRATGVGDLGRVVEDIFGLDVRRFPTPDGEFREVIDEFLVNHPKLNPEVARLLDSAKKEDKDILVNYLSQMDPIYLPLANEFLRYSNYGVISNLKTYFTNIRTISKVAQQNQGRSFFAECRMVEARVLDYIERFIRGDLTTTQDATYWEDLVNSPCPTLYARELRRIHWGRDMVGNTKPTPTHQIKLKSAAETSPGEYRKSILIQASSDFCQTSNVTQIGVGPYVPFFGSFTREKVQRARLDLLASTSLTRAVMGLGVLRGWGKQLNNQYIIDLVDLLLREKEVFIPLNESSEDLLGENQKADQIKAITDVEVGGNIYHRLHSQMERRSALINALSDVSSHFFFSSNPLAYMNAGGKDFTIFFQLLYLYVITLFSLTIDCERDFPNNWCGILVCEHCTVDVSTITINTPARLNIEGISTTTLSLPLTLPTRLFDWHTWSWARGVLEGRSMYSILKVVKYDYYISTGSHDKDIESGESSAFTGSLNTFRQVPVMSVLIGLLQGSFEVTEFIRQWRNRVNLSPPSLLMPYASMVIRTNRVKELVEFFPNLVRSHAEGTIPRQLSKAIMRELFLLEGDALNCLCQLLVGSQFQTESVGTMNNINRLLSIYKKRNCGAELFNQLTSSRSLKFISSRLIEGTWSISQKLATSIHVTRCISTPEALEVCTSRSSYKGFYYSAHIQMDAQVDSDAQDDNRFNCFRLLTAISTSCSKIFEILSLFVVDVSSSYCVCLADGSGSILALILEYFSLSRYLHNTLLDPFGDPRVSPDLNDPPALLSVKICAQDISNGMFSLGETNILRPQFWSSLKSFTILECPMILTMDAEHTDFDYVVFFEHLKDYLEWCMLVHNDVPCCICKVYRHRILDECWEDLVSNGWNFIQPLASDPMSGEVYGIWGAEPSVEYKALERRHGWNGMQIGNCLSKWNATVGTTTECQIELYNLIKDDPNFSKFLNFPFKKYTRFQCPARHCSNLLSSLLKDLWALFNTDLTKSTELFSQVREYSLERVILEMLRLILLAGKMPYISYTGGGIEVLGYKPTSENQGKTLVIEAIFGLSDNKGPLMRSFDLLSRHPNILCCCPSATDGSKLEPTRFKYSKGDRAIIVKYVLTAEKYTAN